MMYLNQYALFLDEMKIHGNDLHYSKMVFVRGGSSIRGFFIELNIGL